MTAQEYIELVVKKRYQPFTKVVVSKAKQMGQHIILKPDQELPPDDDDNTIFIRVDDTA